MHLLLSSQIAKYSRRDEQMRIIFSPLPFSANPTPMSSEAPATSQQPASAVLMTLPPPSRLRAGVVRGELITAGEGVEDEVGDERKRRHNSRTVPQHRGRQRRQHGRRGQQQHLVR